MRKSVRVRIDATVTTRKSAVIHGIDMDLHTHGIDMDVHSMWMDFVYIQYGKLWMVSLVKEGKL